MVANLFRRSLLLLSLPAVLPIYRLFYADWFFHRLDKGYSVWINPFNNVRSYISYSKTRLIVFWSKNPRPLLKYLRRLDETGIHSYIQFTLNDYEKRRVGEECAALARTDRYV